MGVTEPGKSLAPTWTHWDAALRLGAFQSEDEVFILLRGRPEKKVSFRAEGEKLFLRKAARSRDFSLRYVSFEMAEKELLGKEGAFGQENSSRDTCREGVK
jgi:hypothetical protein